MPVGAPAYSAANQAGEGVALLGRRRGPVLRGGAPGELGLHGLKRRRVDYRLVVVFDQVLRKLAFIFDALL